MVFSPYFSDTKKQNGKLKCENSDNIIGKFVGQKSKNYAFSYAKDYEKVLNDGDKSKLVRCKGTTRSTITDEINIDTITNILNNSSVVKNDNYCIR